ncbi:asparaginase [Radiobacillus kanasensis]|uniref:asparaginase n=1 Tax=Radiobacillus kanasensis TaxID=2844358 RepID=UPI001E5E74D0|nr:asparaginase [Radiobacillus kanasensis]UFT97645.1 asparaginase [Radiobacillus kanasensis]
MKKILIIHTGGTISMMEDKESRTVSPAGEHPLGSVSSLLVEYADTTEEYLFHLPSPHITPSHMLELAKVVEQRLEEVDGIVITHGTDTLEETAYFLDLYLATMKPVVVTGAMRSSNEIGSDGLYNLICSIRVASHEEAISKGVMVVMNDEIHTAHNVTKTSTSNIATFQSPQYGPIGIVTKHNVFFHQQLTKSETCKVEQLTHKVVLLKAYAGMDGDIISAVHQAQMDGLVIEGLGQGNLPKDTVGALERVVADQIPVILVSRCYQGIVQPTYTYEGGGSHLKNIGVIFSNGLTGPKARIKLMMTLEKTKHHDTIKSLFE